MANGAFGSRWCGLVWSLYRRRKTLGDPFRWATPVQLSTGTPRGAAPAPSTGLDWLAEAAFFPRVAGVCAKVTEWDSNVLAVRQEGPGAGLVRVRGVPAGCAAPIDSPSPHAHSQPIHHR